HRSDSRNPKILIDNLSLTRSYFPAQNWMTLPFAQNRLGCGKLQGRTDSGLTFVGSADSFL
ncbi:MAG TPA: hypothetical protein VK554_11570, partial [Bradyrhizobium sp.]|nr:hypothetical protein [Bradyrhizobium sp.]